MIKAVIFDQPLGRKGEFEKMEYDGWILQFSGEGASRRANSAPDSLQNLLVQILVYD